MTHYELAKGVMIHTHACDEGGIFANAYLVETARGIVAVDATLSETESKALRKEVEAIGKPLLAVLITHPHPDHVAGITNLIAGDSPRIIATQPVLDLMRRLEEPKRKQWGPIYGAEWVARWTYPNTVLQSGDRVAFDGISYSVLELGAGGDSEANSVWFIDAPNRTAFLGDMVFNGTHSYVADGRLLAWLANLSRLERLCAGLAVVFPGHGPAGAPEGLIRTQRAYLLTLAGHVKELANGRAVLTNDQKKELERRMTEYLPGAGLTFLIGMSADAVAREIQAEPVPDTAFRACAVLKAQPGKEAELLEFTLSMAPMIRAVEGLQRLEVNRVAADGRLVLYYWWASPQHSQAYIAGPVYAAVALKLADLVADHLLLIAQNIDG
jgi:glyoxylase-like metal-dependent hydrolase (beta-lactamase superfamily II)/quinol monooxygenase YgiN